jgi:hypothetical protein
MHKTIKILRPGRISLGLIISIFIFLMLIMPVLSLAADTPLVPCNNNTAPDSNGNLPVKCDFTQLMNMVNIVIHFILYDMVIPIAAIMFAYAGFLLVTAGGEAAGARTKAKSIFTNAAIGLLIAVAAFLIIRTILSILGYNGTWLGFNPF